MPKYQLAVFFEEIDDEPWPDTSIIETRMKIKKFNMNYNGLKSDKLIQDITKELTDQIITDKFYKNVQP